MGLQERALAAARADSGLQTDRAARELQSENSRLLSEMQNLENELQSVERERDRSSANATSLSDEVGLPLEAHAMHQHIEPGMCCLAECSHCVSQHI